MRVNIWQEPARTGWLALAKRPSGPKPEEVGKSLPKLADVGQVLVDVGLWRDLGTNRLMLAEFG